MTNLKKAILIALLILPLKVSADIQFIAPPEQVIRLAREVAYVDFPTVPDILSIIRIESGFNPKATNSNSYGLMQVNDGSFDPATNLTQGAQLLRQYFLMTHSKAGTIEAYNVGIGNYFRSRLRISQIEYLTKFNNVQRRYQNAYKEWMEAQRLSWISLGFNDPDCRLLNQELPRRTNGILFGLYWYPYAGLHRRRVLPSISYRYRRTEKV